MDIKFTGAAGTVTGSCHYIEYEGKKILLDCGLFQGKKEIEELNKMDFPFDPSSIDYLILSHAHIDHSGRIPLLVKKGFKGKIYTSKPTYDLCTIMLIDSAHIHEMEAQWASKKSLRKGGKEIEPLYTTGDAENSLGFFEPVLYEQYIEIDENLTLRFTDAGHILGSSLTELWFKEGEKTTKLVYSGDLGMKNKPIIRDPQIIEKADYLIIESTYGNRLHDLAEERVEKLTNVILKTIKNKGTVVIPSFAVGRTQEIIYELNEYYDKKSDLKIELNNIPVYIDSPLASKATEIFKKNADVFDSEAREKIFSGDNPLEFKNLHFTKTVDESKALNFSDEPKIIISASGMCNAGRIRHHLKHNLWKKNSTIVFVGYQAEGTLGRIIRDGAKEVKLFGEDISILADVVSIEGFSGHADQNGLLEWLEGFKEGPKKIFIVHGEDDSRQEFSRIIEEKYHIETIIPKMDSKYQIKNDQLTMLEEGYNIKLVPQKYDENQEFIMKKVGSSVITDINDKKKEISEDSKVKIQETAEKENEELADIEKINKLKSEIIKLKELSGHAFSRTEDTLKLSGLNVGDYKTLNNLVIELEKTLINLTMQSGE